MPHVRFTSALQRFFPTLVDGHFEGKTVADVLTQVEKRFPGLSDYLTDERGALRKHVNVFIGTRMIQDRTRLSDGLADDAEVCIFQALSGG